MPRVAGSQREMWRPLLTIAGLAGKQWAGYAREALLASLPDDEISTDSATILAAIRTAVNRGYIRLTDYDNRKTIPPVCHNDKASAGWRQGVGFYAVSLKDDHREFTLRFNKDEAADFWNHIIRANSGIRLPERIDDALRALRDDSALRTNAPNVLGLSARTWRDDKGSQHPIFCIVVTRWFNNETETE